MRYNALNIKTFEQEKYEELGVSREPLVGVNAVAQIFPNGLVRAA